MIDDESPAGSWRDAMLFRKHMYMGRDDEEAAPDASAEFSSGLLAEESDDE